MGGALDTPAGAKAEQAARRILVIAGLLSGFDSGATGDDHYGGDFNLPFAELRDALAEVEIERVDWAEALDLPGDERSGANNPAVKAARRRGR